MKGKWIIILALIVIIFISPSKIGVNLNFIGKEDIALKTIKNIEVKSKYKSTVYDENIVYYNGQDLKGLDCNGKELFNLKIISDKYLLDSNKYIDILDKENNTVYSVNKNGKIVFKDKVPSNGIMYKSLSNELYIYAYKKDENNRFNIYDEEYSLKNYVEVEGVITDIVFFDNHIYVVEMNTKGKLNSKVSKYDSNGNLKDNILINDSVVVGLEINKDVMMVVTDSSILNINSDLDIKESIEVNDIKYFSNIYDDSIYTIEDKNVNHIEDLEKKSIKTQQNAKGIINKKDNSIIYTEDTILSIKNKEIKKYNTEIIEIKNVKDNIYMVSLDEKIDLIQIK
ncbi:MAG: hypothetical protein ACRCXT_15190 [Paraclostridium sp.]